MQPFTSFLIFVQILITFMLEVIVSRGVLHLALNYSLVSLLSHVFVILLDLDQEYSIHKTNQA